MRYLILILAATLLFAAPTIAQKKKPTAVGRAAQKAINVEEWVRVGNEKHQFSFAYPKEWTALQTEHYDPDEIIDTNTGQTATDFNAIEINRDTYMQGFPYVLVYSIRKDFQTWTEYGTKLAADLLNNAMFPGTQIVGVDTTYLFKGNPGYDVTYDIPKVGKVRSIVIYANGLRYGLMFTTLEDLEGKMFIAEMPRFERLLETLEIGSGSRAKPN